MTSKREREKLQTERHQLIIQELLRDEDNKYCVDCDAKGPRWASWNIGVFLCIRCAGIHRNLGVHISKVKSVNLDTWTLPQLAMMRDMGNSRARAIYEARLPDSFRRPQSDSALETFIRSKYEQRRYIDPDYVPIKPDLESLTKEIQRLEQAAKKRHSPNAVILGHPPSTVGSGAAKQMSHTENKASEKNSVKTTEADLLGLDLTQSKPSAGQPAIEFFDKLTTNTVTTTEVNQVNLASSVAPVTDSKTLSTGSSLAATSQASANDLLGLDLRGSAAPPPADTVLPTAQSTGVEPVVPVAKVTKDSILALYQQSPNPAPAFNLIPGTSPVSGFAQFAPSSQPSNWQFAPATGSFLASNTNMAGFGEIQMASGQSGMSSLSQSVFASPNALNSTFTAQSNVKVESPGFKSVQQNRLVPSSPAVWPDSSSNGWVQSAPTFPNSFIAQQPAVSASGVPGVGPFTDQASLQTWNMNQFAAPTAPVNTCGNSNFFMPPTFNSGAPAHEAYLSQVQSQLASLHLSGTVNNQQ